MHHYVRVKICGMTQIEDINFAASIGVDAIGLIFYEKSARYVAIEKAEELTYRLPLFLNVVGVFVDAKADFITEVIKRVPLNYLQFHGQETAEFCMQFNKPYIKSIAAKDKDFIRMQMAAHPYASAFLLDTPCATHGGSGTLFDWNMIPETSRKPIILAGGLHAQNVDEIKNKSNIYAVDCCTGVESQPGIKDFVKIRQFVSAIRGENEHE